MIQRRKNADKLATNVNRTKLKNGLVLISETVKNFETLSIGIWVKRGSRHEPKHLSGIAHFLEHMVFKGTKSRSALEIAKLADAFGGEFNAATSREHTCFTITIPKHEVEAGFDLIIDILQNAEFNPIEIDREKKVVLQEIQMTAESPEDQIFEFFLENVYKGNALSRPVLGTEYTVHKFDQASILSYFYHHYNPRTTIIAVAGDVSHKKLQGLIEKKWQDKRKGFNPASQQKHDMKVQQVKAKTPTFRSGVYVKEHSSEQAHMLIGFDGFPIKYQGRIPLFLLNSILGGSMSSTLFQSIREQEGLAYHVYSSLVGFTDCGIATMYVATTNSEIGKCLNLIGNAIRELVNTPFPIDHLEVIKKSIKNAIRMDRDSMEVRMTGLARSELFFKRYLTDSEICDQIDSVTPKQIQALAQKLFQKPVAIGLLGNVSSDAVNWKKVTKQLAP